MTPPPTVEILAIGNELLRGEILDTNTQWLCRLVTARGGRVGRVTLLADVEAEIADAVRAAIERGVSPTALMEPGMIGLMEPGEPGDFAFLDGVIFWSFVTLFFSRIVYRSGPVLASGNFCRRGSTGRRCA